MTTKRYVAGGSPFGFLVFDTETQERAYVGGERLGTYPSIPEAHAAAEALNEADVADMVDKLRNNVLEAMTLGTYHEEAAAEAALEAYVRTEKASAWDEGRTGAIEDTDWRNELVEDSPNPYREDAS